MRIDLYTAIHKTQRFHLGRLAERLGRADTSRSENWPPLGAEVRTWVGHLKAHAEHEHAFIHPLFARHGERGAHLDTEHESLKRAMNQLEETISAGDWQQLYALFVEFLGIYLVHIAEEERLQAEVLWRNCSDAELVDVLNRFKKSRSPEEAGRDLELMLPALSLDELTQIYLGIRESAPPAVWDACVSIAQRVLSASEVQALESRLAAYD